MMIKSLVFISVFMVVCHATTIRPTTVTTKGPTRPGTLVASVTDSPSTTLPPQEKKPLRKPRTYFLDVKSNITSRYSITHVTSRVVNLENEAQETTFFITLPESAFISNFSMEIQGKVYVAYVKEKQEAKNIYDAAVSSGQSAAHVEARDSNNFRVSVNIGAKEKITFRLKYEELLVRRRGFYEHEINITPGDIVDSFSIEVYIKETRNISFVKVPEIRNDVEVKKNEKDNSLAIININENEATVSYKPNKKQQLDISESGIQGQFVVQYDLARGGVDDSGEIQVIDGTFVHFFAPENLPVIKKHVVFVIDTSGSMSGRKIEQTKDALMTILSDLNLDDWFSIVEFDSSVKVWNGESVVDIDGPSNYNSYRPRPPPVPRPLPALKPLPHPGAVSPTVVKPAILPYTTTTSTTTTTTEPFVVPRVPIPATPENIKLAKEYVSLLVASGGTNINGALVESLKHTHESANAVDRVPLVIFLTDGEPTSGETNPTTIIDNIKKENFENEVSIFTLAFGYGADYNFLKKLSLQNYGFARKIYEAADAALQLEDFYSEISAPLLSDIQITYLNDTVDNSSVTNTVFNSYFSGCELVVTGKLRSPSEENLEVEISANSGTGPVKIYVRPPIIIRPPFPPIYPIPPILPITPKPRPPQGIYSNFLERLWAFKTIQSLQDKILQTKNETEKESYEKEALRLALKYNFVTDFTSMVVTKPNDTAETTEVEESSVGLEAADIGTRVGYGGGGPQLLSAARPVAIASFAAAPPARPGVSYNKRRRPVGATRWTTTTFRPTRHPATTVTTPKYLPPTVPSPPSVQWSGVDVSLNGTVTLLNGTMLMELGFLEDDSAPWASCSLTSGASGSCQYLHYCPRDEYLNDLTVFIEESCDIQGYSDVYTGVCCPDSPATTG